MTIDGGTIYDGANRTKPADVALEGGDVMGARIGV